MTTWQIDTAHTVVGFTAKHMMITKVRGIFKGVTGTIEFDEADPTRSSVEVAIPAATVETGMEPRDNHLRSADFLDAENHPTLTFRSTSIAPRGDRWAITGDLTIRGVTRPVVLDTEALGIVTGMDGRRHAGFEATHEDQALRLGPDLERRPRDRRLARLGRRHDRARGRGRRGRRGGRARAGRRRLLAPCSPRPAPAPRRTPAVRVSGARPGTRPRPARAPVASLRRRTPRRCTRRR